MTSGLDGIILTIAASPDWMCFGNSSVTLPVLLSILLSISVNLQAIWEVWQSRTGAYPFWIFPGWFMTITWALAQEHCTSKSGEAGRGVHDIATSPVPDTHCGEEAVAPDPVAGWAVDQQTPQGSEHKVWLELDAVGNRTHNQRRGDDCEHAKVELEENSRKAQAEERCSISHDWRVDWHVFGEEELSWGAKITTHSCAK